MTIAVERRDRRHGGFSRRAHRALASSTLRIAAGLLGFASVALGTTSAASATPPPGFFPRPSNPVTVTPQPEASQAASKVISSAAGGTVRATADDGTKYTLEMPAGALSSDEKITMTPVSAVAGSPLGDLVAGVEITPHGLQLSQPATLRIAPASPVRLRRQAGFDAATGGEDFSLYPINPGTGVVMQLNHFSTVGIANATNAQVKTALADMPVRTQAQYQQLIANVLRKARDSGGPIDTDALGGLTAAYYRDIVKPLTDKALTDDTYAESAGTELIAWARTVQLLDLDGDPRIKPQFDGWPDLLTAIIKNAVQQRYQRCVASDDLSEISRLMSAERLAQILGLDLGGADRLAQKCAHFELKVHTVSEHYRDYGGQAFTGDITVEDDVPIAMNELLQGTGEADPDYTNWQITEKYGCCSTATGTTVNAPSSVDGLGLDYNVVETKQPDGRIVREVPAPKLALQFDPGETTEDYMLPSDPNTYHETIWNQTWLDGHHGEQVGSSNVFDLSGWDTRPPGSGQLIATKSYPTSTYCGGTYHPGCTPITDKITETTTLKLYHRPR
jgi:hypothetical protein